MYDERTETESASNTDIKEEGKRVADVEQTEAEGKSNVRRESESENKSKGSKNTSNKKAEKRKDSKKAKDKDHKGDTNEKKEEDTSSSNSGNIEMVFNEEEKKSKKTKESKKHKGDKEDVDKDDKVEMAKCDKTKKKGSPHLKRTKEDIKVENKSDEKGEPLSKIQDDLNEKKTKGGLSDFFCKYNVFQKTPYPSHLRVYGCFWKFQFCLYKYINSK